MREVPKEGSDVERYGVLFGARNTVHRVRIKQLRWMSLWRAADARYVRHPPFNVQTGWSVERKTCQLWFQRIKKKNLTCTLLDEYYYYYPVHVTNDERRSTPYAKSYPMDSSSSLQYPSASASFSP